MSVANPLLGAQPSAPQGYGSPLQDGADHGVYDLLDFDDHAELGLVALIAGATAFLVLLKVSGFRAMIAVGRD